MNREFPPLFARATMFVMHTAERVIATLRAHEAELRQAGLRSLSLFGSVAGGGTETDRNIVPAGALADILENLERIQGYVAGLDREAFGGDTLRRDAVERCLERICEAAFRLGAKAPELAPSQPSGDIPG